MSSIFSELGGITGGVAAEGLAFAAGFAAGRALEPAAVTISQDAWNAAQVRRIDAQIAAAIAAEDIADYSVLADEASYSGYDASRFAYLYHVNLTAPGVGELLDMVRRQTINSGNFSHGLRKNKLEPMWDTAIAELANQFISATDIAYMMVRGVLPDDGLLGESLPTQADKLKLPPQLNLDPVTEASKSGWDKERLAAMVARSGLAMAPVMAAQANFRGILTDNDYLLTIARGDLFPAYAEPVLEASRQILTADQAAELQLRGYIDAATRRKLTELHGMTDANSDYLYDVLGRAPGIHAVTTGLARGGTYDGQPKTIPSPFLEAVERANIRPEWYDLEYANRYSYPSGFQIKSEAAALGADLTNELLLEVGWAPKWATYFSNHWSAGAGTGAAAADPHVKKAETTLFTEAHKAYVKTGLTQAQVMPALNALTVPATAQAEVFKLWDAEKLLASETPPA